MLLQTQITAICQKKFRRQTDSQKVCLGKSWGSVFTTRQEVVRVSDFPRGQFYFTIPKDFPQFKRLQKICTRRAHRTVCSGVHPGLDWRGQLLIDQNRQFPDLLLVRTSSLRTTNWSELTVPNLKVTKRVGIFLSLTAIQVASLLGGSSIAPTQTHTPIFSPAPTSAFTPVPTFVPTPNPNHVLILLLLLLRLLLSTAALVWHTPKLPR